MMKIKFSSFSKFPKIVTQIILNNICVDRSFLETLGEALSSPLGKFSNGEAMSEVITHGSGEMGCGKGLNMNQRRDGEVAALPLE